MKAIILAGGFGTRLWPLKLPVPKPLVDINGKTLTEHVLSILKKSGVNEIILSTHYQADKIMGYFGDGTKHGFKIDYAHEETPLGTAGPLIVMHKEGRKLQEHFFMMNGDNLFEDINLKEVADFHIRNNALATIILTKVEDVSSYGVAELWGNKILRFIEKPSKEEAPSNLVNSGYYVLSPEVFDIAFELHKKFNKVMMENHVFPKIAEMGRLYGYVHGGYWQDTGTPERLELARKKFK